MMIHSRGGAMGRRGPRGGGPAKRYRILRAAIKIFSQKGFFNSKVSDIAQAAGVADGTIYLYFKNKDDLLISLFEEKMAEVVADVRERVAAEDGALSRLKIFIENHMGLLLREAGLIEVLQVELRQSNKFMKDYVPVKFLEYLDVISEILELGKRGGTFRQDMKLSGVDLTQEQIALQDMARKFAANEIRPKAVEYDHTGTFPEEIFKKAFGLGLMSGYIPEEYGGLGLKALDSCIIDEELAWGCSGIATSMDSNGLALTPILVAGGGDQTEGVYSPS